MQVRFVYERYFATESPETLHDRVQLLWSGGKSSIEEAIAQYVQQELQGSGIRFSAKTIQIVRGGGNGWCERFIFVGGRESIINCLYENEDFSIDGRSGIALGVVTDRKKKLFGKNKTLVAVCPIPTHSGRLPLPVQSAITPVTDFIGEGIPVESNGRKVTFAQLAAIIQKKFYSGV